MQNISKPKYRTASAKQPSQNRQFEGLKATELYCPRCKRSMPVRERLLLVLPEGDKYSTLRLLRNIGG